MERTATRVEPVRLRPRTPFAAIGFAAAALLARALTPAPAWAQYVCGLRPGLLAELERRHGERPVAIGLSGDDVVYEITASADGASCSLLSTSRDGLACLLAVGTHLELAQPGAAKPQL